MISTESVECRVFETSKEALEYGKGGIAYEYDGEGREFPKDVISVGIVMPVNWARIAFA